MTRISGVTVNIAFNGKTHTYHHDDGIVSFNAQLCTEDDAKYLTGDSLTNALNVTIYDPTVFSRLTVSNSSMRDCSIAAVINTDGNELTLDGFIISSFKILSTNAIQLSFVGTLTSLLNSSATFNLQGTNVTVNDAMDYIASMHSLEYVPSTAGNTNVPLFYALDNVKETIKALRIASNSVLTQLPDGRITLMKYSTEAPKETVIELTDNNQLVSLEKSSDGVVETSIILSYGITLSEDTELVLAERYVNMPNGYIERSIEFSEGIVSSVSYVKIASKDEVELQEVSVAANTVNILLVAQPGAVITELEVHCNILKVSTLSVKDGDLTGTGETLELDSPYIQSEEDALSLIEEYSRFLKSGSVYKVSIFGDIDVLPLSIVAIRSSRWSTDVYAQVVEVDYDYLNGFSMTLTVRVIGAQTTIRNTLPFELGNADKINI